MQISNDRKFRTSKWVDFSKKYKWTLSDDSRMLKKVYVRFKDKNGKVSRVVSDHILFKTKTNYKKKHKKHKEHLIKKIHKSKINLKTKRIPTIKHKMERHKKNKSFHNHSNTKRVLHKTNIAKNKKPNHKNYKEKITIKQLVDLLIALEIIPKNKAHLVLNAISSI